MSPASSRSISDDVVDLLVAVSLLTDEIAERTVERFLEVALDVVPEEAQHSFESREDVGNRDRIRVVRERVPALGSAVALDEAGLLEDHEDLLQVVLRYSV